MSVIQHYSNRSIKPFKSSEEYLYAMKEDLAEWLRDLYGISITVINFFEVLESGAVLCRHANNATRAAADFLRELGHQAPTAHLPTAGVTYVESAQPATFLARDNISNFINWCRQEMGIKDVLMFETDDLVLRKNEKNFVLCLLEVARRASRFGMAVPVLIQLEQEIEEEICEELHLPLGGVPKVRRARSQLSDFRDLDEMVQHLVSRCTCPAQFPMAKVSEGRYRAGDSSALIFVRILRSHVMVRVGGGWDTLEHYLDKHDPCRCTSLTHKQPRMTRLQHPSTPVHEVRTLPTAQHGDGGGAEPRLLVSRTQSPPPPVPWVTAGGGTRPWSARCPTRRPSPSPEPRARVAAGLRPPSPDRVRARSATPTPSRNLPREDKEECVHSASTRTGRKLTRQSPSPRLASSLPRPTQTSPAPQPETQRPSTPLVFQKTAGTITFQLQHNPASRITETWTKSQFTSKLRHGSASNTQNIEAESRVPSPIGMSRKGGLYSAGLSTPVRCYVPIRGSRPSARQPSTAVHLMEGAGRPLQVSNFIRTFSPTKQSRSKASEEHLLGVLTPAESGADVGLVDHPPSSYSSYGLLINSSITEGARRSRSQALQSSAKNPLIYPGRYGESLDNNCALIAPPELGRAEGVREISKRYFFTPPPISPEEEATLYRSLEHEILSNLKLLNTHTDDDSSLEGGQDGGGMGRAGDRFCTNDPVPCPSKPSCQNLPAAEDRAATDSNGRSSVVMDDLATGSFLLYPSDIQARTLELRAGNHQASKPGTENSMGCSVESTDLTETTQERQDFGVTNPSANRAPKVFTMAQYRDLTLKSSIPITPSSKLRRVLKRPERVPSIYKLKLRPRVRPRQDNRPERKPSRIPTPLFYRRGQPGRGSQREKRRDDTEAAPCCLDSSTKSKEDTPVSLPRAKMAAKETVGDQAKETWL
nr:GAS2-like protein 2 [Paramormyrops kingsleyae]